MAQLKKDQDGCIISLLSTNNKFYVRKRGAGDIWENLFEFILLETPKPVTVEKHIKTPGFRGLTGDNKIDVTDSSKLYKQQLTHQTIRGRFFHLKAKKQMPLKTYKAVTLKELKKLPFPKFITRHSSENGARTFER